MQKFIRFVGEAGSLGQIFDFSKTKNNSLDRNKTFKLYFDKF